PRGFPSAPPPRAGPTPDLSGHRAPSTPWRSSLVPIASWSHPGGGHRIDSHEGVVVRHLARGVDDPTADEHISLGPVDLYVPRSDRSETQATPIGTEFVRQLNFVPLSKVQGRGVFLGDEDVPAPCAEERIDVFLDHRIELFSPACAQEEPSLGDVEVGERHDGE